MPDFSFADFKLEFNVRMSMAEIQLLSRALKEGHEIFDLPIPEKRKTVEGFKANHYSAIFKQLTLKLLKNIRKHSAQTQRPWYYEAEKQMLIEDNFIKYIKETMTKEIK